MAVLETQIQYTYHGKAENAAQKGLFTIRDTRFTDTVTLDVVCDPSRKEEVKTLFMEITAGTALFLRESTELEKVPL